MGSAPNLVADLGEPVQEEDRQEPRCWACERKTAGVRPELAAAMAAIAARAIASGTAHPHSCFQSPERKAEGPPHHDPIVDIAPTVIQL